MMTNSSEQKEYSIITDEEAEKTYNHSSLKWQWGKPYKDLTDQQKTTLKKITYITKRGK